MSEPIDVAYFFDAGFADCTLVSAWSVAAQTARPVRFLAHCSSMTPDIRDAFERLERHFPHVSLSLRELDGSRLKDPQNPVHTAATFGRLLLAETHPGRAIYMDGDTAAFDDIGTLWDMPLKGAPIGAARDAHLTRLAFRHASWRGLGKHQRQDWATRTAGPLAKTIGSYFNAGVVLFDFARIRELGLAEAMADIALAQSYPFADQDHLNLLFSGLWADIGLRWNCTDLSLSWSRALPRKWREDCLTAATHPGIVHYAAGGKPWLREAPKPRKSVFGNPLHDASKTHFAAYHRLRAQCETALDLKLFRKGS
jgi:lipopolysaccharide biosynthesis glycosyltransferase